MAYFFFWWINLVSLSTGKVALLTFTQVINSNKHAKYGTSFIPDAMYLKMEQR